MSTPPRHQRGQSMTEYVVICAVLAFVLFVPISDTASSGESKTTVELIFDGFRKAYKNFSYALSLPSLPI